jgi:peptidyl-prolyl cis-trans isomerase SurA
MIQLETFKNKFFIVILFLSIFPLQAQQVLDQIAAIVDDDIILQSEVTQAAYLLAMQMSIDPVKSPKEFQKIQSTSLDNLINQKVLLIQADKDTIKADERQVETLLQQQMQNITQQLGGEQKVEEYFGTTMSKIRRNYRDEIEKNVRITRVRDQKLANQKISRREVEQFYTAKKDSIGQIPESVDISHILIVVKPGEVARKAAYEKIKSIRDKIEAGEDFNEMARTNSEDPGSASRGGDLGLMTRGDFVRPFEEVAFNLKPGELSDIVETEFGYHIIRLIEKRGDKIHAEHILVSIKPTREDEVIAAEKIKKIHTELKSGAKFTDLVGIYSDDESTKNQQGHLGTFEMSQLRETAKEFVYALKGLKPGDISDPIRTPYGFHILILNSREEARELSLDKDWDRLERMALEYKKQKEFKRWLDEIKENVFIEIKKVTI